MRTFKGHHEVAIRRMFREGVVEARVDQEISEARVVYPMNNAARDRAAHDHIRLARGLTGRAPDKRPKQPSPLPVNTCCFPNGNVPYFLLETQ